MAATSRQSSAPTAKRAAIEAALLDATEALLAEGASFADLGVERIATQAGITRTAFYFYFADKRELLMALTADVNELLLEQANLWWSGEGEPAVRLERALTNVARLFGEHAVLLKALGEVAAYDEQVAEHWQRLIGQFLEATEERICEEQAAGLATCSNPSATAFALTWMTEGVLSQQILQLGLPADPQLIDALVEIWVRSVYGSA
ncbi:MAG: TetR/AcrR family transcriptional regulator [Solirubrobacteraceae bacterium]|jgi:TetR/AcrR family transcriptional regulator, ethionamide resistance regulator|nr:TetR/AcrR family transcriptional regulator [Solirubrobacteraceae bacterium]MDP4672777.1 TetR/AcrR family transcriptional regulator [Solirubrobacteraceae bacterium]MDP4921323.1 TetR/AcrR family transcriptional regulator [Solirubrobacteraceae bacterium]MDP5033487.1 TetR/AcrR family transcriptional regulator [Solirubrobacteraceae bacterium]